MSIAQAAGIYDLEDLRGEVQGLIDQWLAVDPSKKSAGIHQALNANPLSNQLKNEVLATGLRNRAPAVLINHYRVVMQEIVRPDSTPISRLCDQWVVRGHLLSDEGLRALGDYFQLDDMARLQLADARNHDYQVWQQGLRTTIEEIGRDPLNAYDGLRIAPLRGTMTNAFLDAVALSNGMPHFAVLAKKAYDRNPQLNPGGFDKFYQSLMGYFSLGNTPDTIVNALLEAVPDDALFQQYGAAVMNCGKSPRLAARKGEAAQR